MAWQEVGDRVFTWRFPFLDQQIGVVLGGSDVLVVDTRSAPSHAREVADNVRELTRDPISIVVDTHWHWDHTFGNAAFPTAPIWAHVRAAERIVARGPATLERIAEAYPELAAELRAETMQLLPPDRTFEDRATVEVGDRVVELSYQGRGHTDGDVVAFVPGANVLFAGDLLENDATPSFGDAYPLEWPDTVERLLPLALGAVVPGHGTVGDRSFVERQLGELRALVSIARRVHAAEITLDDAIAASPFEPETSRAPFERTLAQLRGELD